MKKLLNTSLVRSALGRLIGAYMAFAGATTRWTVVNGQAAEALWAKRGPVILCLWHGRLFLAHSIWMRGRLPTRAMVSNSREGDVIVAAFSGVGVGAIRGSSDKAGKDKGGSEALRESIRFLKAKGTVAVTPDGPRGPRMRAELGAVQLAKLTGAPLLPSAWSARPAAALKSWDRFLLPLPFGRGVYMFGDPVTVPRTADDATMERIRRTLEDELIRLTQEADRRVGAPAIEPAAPPVALEDAPAA